MSLVSENPVTGSARAWLRIEGLAVLLATLFCYQQQRASWLLFVALFLAPDLFMLGYLAGPRIGAAAYNIVHSYVLPLGLAAFALLDHRPALLPYVLIWMAHIGADRALGYGLKYSSAFGHTHLGWLGKQKPEERLGLG